MIIGCVSLPLGAAIVLTGCSVSQPDERANRQRQHRPGRFGAANRSRHGSRSIRDGARSLDGLSDKPRQSGLASRRRELVGGERRCASGWIHLVNRGAVEQADRFDEFAAPWAAGSVTSSATRRRVDLQKCVDSHSVLQLGCERRPAAKSDLPTRRPDSLRLRLDLRDWAFDT